MKLVFLSDSDKGREEYLVEAIERDEVLSDI